MRIGLFNDTSVSGHHGCTAVMTTLLRALAARDADPVWLWPVGVPWQPRVRWLDRRPVDAIVVNGEGTIHHSAERQRTRDLLELPAYARKRGVPIHLLNASISDLDAPAIEALRGFDTIHVRESESLGYLSGLGIAATMVPDLSLGVTFAPPSSERDGILVTDSVLRETAKALRTVAAEIGADHARMRPKKRGPRLARLRHRLEDKWPPLAAGRNWRPRSDVDAFGRRLSTAALVLTGRFHTVLLSLATFTPVIALPSNTRKIEAVMADSLGHEGRMLELDLLRDPATIERLRAGVPYAEADRAAIRRYLEQAEMGRSRMFDDILRQVGR
ncbi:polysaccharide pyruvyl transferase family protein [Jannaschia rubra]|uniref:Polysaccharide pyruvyl transferase CsaB n=1 Tax=Jannaschia rubra TaxID=282197 RepID=A0A0M6XK25_9RHOB|nr:polysaccharide pyruvyl transferase family protein [Jannaschia rubra]CTQ31278.1 polysaccharide pyruvyl transferase CsaB [Jannaschia rubra]SFF90434.1 Polysaccharide pyruvyl transferase family protein WcaK [Jannaschia rubra]